MKRPRLIAAWALAFVASTAHANDAELSPAQRTEMETLRGEIAAGIQLQAYDLLDELVHGWLQRPVFDQQTPVVLGDVGVPVGFGSGMKALVETHLAGLLVDNPRTNAVLVHCPRCTAVVIHSGAQGTVISRGVDNPAALAEAGASLGSHHALFVDFEAEGTALVLRARITRLEPTLPIVYAKTLSTTTSAPALLRTGERLKSAREARQEFDDALRGRSWYLVPLRMGLRAYAAAEDVPVVAQPFGWIQMGVEGALSQARLWTAGFALGFSWAPESHWGWLAQARISRLLSGAATSLTRPDLYAFVGASIISVHGDGSSIFRNRIPTLETLLGQVNRVEPKETFAAFPLGLELRVKNRIGVGVYLESAPALSDADAIGTYLDLGIVAFQSYGVEVSFCF